MAVAGAVSELPEPARQDGAGVALKTEGRFTRTSSEAATGSSGGTLAAAQGDAWLVRVGFEGSRPFALGDGGSVVPSVEVGLRRDGGDAQSGVGAETYFTRRRPRGVAPPSASGQTTPATLRDNCRNSRCARPPEPGAVAAPAPAPATRTRWWRNWSGDVRGPVVHQHPAPVEQVAAPVGRFHAVGVDVRKRQLAHLARRVGALRRPVPKA